MLNYDPTAAGAGKSFHIKLSSVKIKARFVKMLADKFLANDEKLKGERMNFPIRRVKMVSGVMPTGLKSFRLNNFIQGQLPRRIILAFQDNDIYNGMANKNCFNFLPHNITSIRCNFNGEDIPREPLKFDWATHDYHDGFNTLTRLHNSDRSVNISFYEYRGGYFLLPFAFQPKLSGNETMFMPHSTGHLDIILEVGEALTKPLQIIAYCEFDNMVQVDYNRNIHKNY